MEILKLLLIALGSYLLGSVSLSIFLSRHMFGGDVRTHGSGNAGATNMARVYGMMAGALTLAADMVKAAVSMVGGYLLLGGRAAFWATASPCVTVSEGARASLWAGCFLC